MPAHINELLPREWLNGYLCKQASNQTFYPINREAESMLHVQKCSVQHADRFLSQRAASVCTHAAQLQTKIKTEAESFDLTQRLTQPGLSRPSKSPAAAPLSRAASAGSETARLAPEGRTTGGGELGGPTCERWDPEAGPNPPPVPRPPASPPRFMRLFTV